MACQPSPEGLATRTNNILEINDSTTSSLNPKITKTEKLLQIKNLYRFSTSQPLGYQPSLSNPYKYSQLWTHPSEPLLFCPKSGSLRLLADLS
jgi:hypothetical protein